MYKRQTETRDITKSLTGSGTLEPADSYTVNTLVSGEVLSDTFEEGDQVEEGQLLYTLDSSNACLLYTSGEAFLLALSLDSLEQTGYCLSIFPI